MKLYSAAALKSATCEPKKNCNTDGKMYFEPKAEPAQGGHVAGFTVACMGVAAPAGGDKVADEKACDALKDASDEAKTACKTWAGKKCADETDDAKKKECEGAKASAKALAASALAVAALAALM
jgi:hypothetical protein